MMHDLSSYKRRLIFLLVLFILGLIGLIARLIFLNVIDRDFLLQQSQARILRSVVIPAYRGLIVDRTGTPLAISTPLDSIWVNPQAFKSSYRQLLQFAKIFSMNPKVLHKKIQRAKKRGRGFIYIRRMNSPNVAKAVLQLKILGVFIQREYKRFYPEGEVAAHVVGLTNIDDQGQEGLELGFNDWLDGKDGKGVVIKDRLGRTIADVALLKKPVQGKDLVLSIDHRIQYLAYRELKAAVEKYHAESGSVVVLATRTGEILAMVNQPSYNPNNRPKIHDGRFRNRAVTDVFEPGSTMKPFTIAQALASGQYTPDSTIDTSPGRMKVGGYEIKDDGLNYGVINLQQILQKSSNIGAAKIMLSLPAQNYWDLLSRLGFGHRTASGFPGEVPGILVPRSTWYPSVVATLAYGYGIAVTALQLAHAYQILADGGIKMPVSFLKLTTIPKGTRVMSKTVAQEIINMLQTVVEKGGTGTRAQVPGYKVAGKTGTAYIANKSGYDKTRFIASFVGIAPANHPQLVVAVVVRDPHGQHFGGLVAAPVFSKVMSGALRLLDISPSQ